MSLNILNSHFILLPIVVRIAILENVDFIRNSPPPKEKIKTQDLCSVLLLFCLNHALTLFEPLLIIYIC